MAEVNDEVRELLAEAAKVDGTPPVSDQALLAVSQGKRALVRFRSTVDVADMAGADSVVVEVAPVGAIDAVGIIGEGEVDLVVRPSARGRGVGGAALRALLLHEDPKAGDELRAWAHGEHAAARSLLRRAGFEPLRSLLRMTLEPSALSSAIREARPMPEGFRLASYEPGSIEQANDWVRVNAAAFIDHPEQGRVTVSDFETMTAEPWFIAEDLRLAYDTRAEAPAANTARRDPLAGFTWVKTTREDGATESELYVLGVAPVYAGRGLGAALLGETFRRMERHSPDRITLYVDGENKNAVELYERAGFVTEQESTQFLRKYA